MGQRGVYPVIAAIYCLAPLWHAGKMLRARYQSSEDLWSLVFNKLTVAVAACGLFLPFAYALGIDFKRDAAHHIAAAVVSGIFIMGRALRLLSFSTKRDSFAHVLVAMAAFALLTLALHVGMWAMKSSATSLEKSLTQMLLPAVALSMAFVSLVAGEIPDDWPTEMESLPVMMSFALMLATGLVLFEIKTYKWSADTFSEIKWRS